MWCLRWKLGILTVAAVLGPLLAGADGTSEDLAHNRRLLEEWRRDPEHMARLRKSLTAFRALPPDRQDRIRALDRDLHELDSIDHARMWRVMERYGTWLTRLPEDDRRFIEGAAEPAERLKRIQQVRERQWVERLPRARRDLLAPKEGDERAALVRKWKEEERLRRDEWRVAVRHWDALTLKRPLESRLSDFPADVQNFVTEQLQPMLSPVDADRLKQAEGQWPLYPVTLVELADKYLIRLPGPSTGPSTSKQIMEQLPPEVRDSLVKENRLPAQEVGRIKGLARKWPDYAIEWLKIANRPRLGGKPNPTPVQLPPTVAPSRPHEFSFPVQRFIKQQLLRVLSAEERERLDSAQGQWPRYPQTLAELANRHNLQIPGMGLPGPRERWDRYRSLPAIDTVVLPEPSESALRDFIRDELMGDEDSALNLAVSDPVGYEAMKRKYFDKYPRELERLRKADEMKFKKQPNRPGKPKQD